MTIIRVTNPRQKIAMGGKIFVCAVCGSKYDTWDEGVACAVRDYERKDEAVSRTAKRTRTRRAESAGEQSAKELMETLRLPPLPKPKYVPAKKVTTKTVYTVPAVPPARDLMEQLRLPSLTTSTSTSNIINAVTAFQSGKQFANAMLTTPSMGSDGRWKCARCGNRYVSHEDAQLCAEFEIAQEMKATKPEHDCRYCGTSAHDCAPQDCGCCPECHEEDTHGLDIDQWGSIIYALPSIETRKSDYLFGTIEVEGT
jgi:hypothetical protein